MTKAPVVRLHLFFAAETDLAVIIRQGPTRQFRMILWDRKDDSFQDGQWTKNKVYIDRCALSPDGKHFLYFMLDGNWSSEAEGAYTAISHPPYWTAISLFPEGSTWGGGGTFLDTKRYVAVGGDDIIGRAKGLRRVLLRREGEDGPFKLVYTDGKPAPFGPEVVDRLISKETPPPPELSQYDTQGGCLYRRHGGEMTLIRDFTDMAFEPIRAPYDHRPERAANSPTKSWHPLDP